jgi:hypothetical protein
VTFGPDAFLLGAGTTVVLFVVASGGVGLVTGLVTLLAIAGSEWPTLWGLIPWTGACAAIGRLAVVRLVTTRDEVEIGA